MNFKVKISIFTLLLFFGSVYAQTPINSSNPIPTQVQDARTVIGVIGLIFFIIGGIIFYAYLVNLMLYLLEMNKRHKELTGPILMFLISFFFIIAAPICAFFAAKDARKLKFFKGWYKTTYRLGQAGLVAIFIALISIIVVIILPSL